MNYIRLYREIIQKLPTEKLNTLFFQSMLIANKINDVEFEKWIKEELDGYKKELNKNNKERKVSNLPSYRIVPGFYLDQTGNQIRFHNTEYEYLMNYPIVESISILEEVIRRNEKYMTVQNHKINDEIFKETGVKVDKFIVPTTVIHSMMNKIRYQLADKLYSLELHKQSDNTLIDNREIKIKIKELLIHEKIEEAIDLLLQAKPDLESECIVFLSDYNSIKKRRRLNISEEKDLEIGMRKLIFELAELSREI